MQYSKPIKTRKHKRFKRQAQINKALVRVIQYKYFNKE